MTRLLLAAVSAVVLAACGGATLQAQPKAQGSGAPAETRPPNAKGQAPAFPGQTRAPNVPGNVAYQASDYVTGLEQPWGLAFLPNGALLITEKAGRLRVFENGRLSPPVAGTPAVDTGGQGGLLGIAVDPDYAKNGFIYLAFAEAQGDGTNNTALARGRLISAAGAPPRLEGTQVIWRQQPSIRSGGHFGGRVVAARDGTLYVTTGDRMINASRPNAQRLDAAIGKVLRITRDGKPAPGNPFAGRADAKPEVFSLGHRNIQAAALHPRTGALWEVEHGTRGGDELNRVQAGKNYGWPDAAYGIEYQGGPINAGITQKAGTEQPVYSWDPVIAPSGMAFYEANAFPAWKGSLFVGGLATKRVSRLTLNGDKVTGEEWLFGELGERIRDVVVGPDGALYLATDNDRGRVIRIGPK